MVSKFVSSEPTPNTKLLPSVDGVVPTGHEKWTICTQGFGRLDALFSDFPVWDVFREKHVGQALTGHLANSFDSEHEVTVGMSVVKHIVSLGG
ncbi:hypothetical protein phiPsal1_031 [Pontimonas phage phiPsal1]|nr:hypothetical protein phiPsal1_031 [Pontimonas phage phiPsal1]